ncbi:MAG TPA: hypothetical protein VFG07_07295 [Thermoplasmata archaeon]|nr:hypothetical protein [Thermoplasmata archaeon]
MPANIGPGPGHGLPQNPKVRSWHAARSLKSRLSADVDLGKLRFLLRRLVLDPECVAAATDTFLEWAADHPDEGADGGRSIGDPLYGLRSWP